MAVALAARLAAGALVQSRIAEPARFYFGDSDTYWELGRAIAAGEPYQYRSEDARVMRTPGYPLLLAGMFWIVGDDPPVMAARALSAVLGTLAVGVAAWWSASLFDRRTAFVAGWIAALYPGGVAMGAFVLSEAPFCPLMLLQLALWGKAWQAESSRLAVGLAIAGGVAGGAATLMRPSWLLFLPFALVVGMAFARRGRQLVIGCAMAASLVACMLPWWIHNARVTGRFVATTLQRGASLYDGLNPEADGSSDMRFVPGFVAQQRAADAAAGVNLPLRPPFEYRLDRRMMRAALDWARAHPRRVVELAGIKFVRIWNVWPNEANLRNWPVRLVVAGTYVPLLACGLIGVWRYTPRGWPYALAWLPAVYLTLLHVTFVGSIRYREPAMLALTVLAAAVVSGVSGANKDRTESAARGSAQTE